MIAASFYTFTYWLAFGAVCVYLLLLVGREMDRRARVRRLRERRLRRALLDARRPERWLP